MNKTPQVSRQVVKQHTSEDRKTLKRHVIPFPRCNKSLEEDEELKQSNKEKFKKDYNLQLVPINPTESS